MKYEMKPVIDEDKILVVFRGGFFNEELLFLTIDEIFQAFDEKYPGRFVRVKKEKVIESDKSLSY